ncbi:hypothetical protein EGC86_20440 [Shewanella frigidimarina]|uniref:hypothetical protein n=1 Tax=Shewanella frigidimarina TaxID=56812 RepID=UPI000F4D41E7|nr:hypothetical protein [Shewanella frigidimarina]RPA57580.1 hypothetical protein EGC86_20440 [Shewanella frigidimarina]
MHNKIGSFTGITALVISMISLYFSYQGSLDRKEYLRLSINPISSGYESTIKAPVGELIPALLSTKWDIVITNTSDRTTTILESDIYLHGENGRKEYSGMVQGIYTSDDKSLYLPLTLESGQHVKLKATIGYEMSDTAYHLLEKSYDLSKSVTIDEIQKFLCSYRIDFRGNEAKCSNGLRTVNYNSNSLLYIFSVSTARDNNFQTAGFWYKVRTTY